VPDVAPPAPPDVRALVASAVQALRASQWSSALALLERALAADPNLREQLAPFRATCFLRTGFPDLAAKVVQGIRPEKLGPKELLVLARIMREAKALDEAERLLARIVSRDPTQTEAKQLLQKIREETVAGSDPIVALARRKLAPLITRVEPLAVGGMAVVCRGYHTRLRRDIAIKILNPEYADMASAQDRFLLEAVTLVNLQHPNLVEAYSIYRQPRFTAYVMELLDGAISTEQSARSKGPFPWTEALRFLVAVTDALALCHARGLVHRDVKPDNILILPDGRVKLIDLGAADFGRSQAGSSDVFTGTLRYSAPEALLRKPLGPPADLYSLAITFHDLVMGMSHDATVPPDPTTFPEEAQANLRTRGVGRLLRDILFRCLDPSPAKRYPDARALRADLAKLPVAVAALPAATAAAAAKPAPGATIEESIADEDDAAGLAGGIASGTREP
jgi:hypothetical protein